MSADQRYKFPHTYGNLYFFLKKFLSTYSFLFKILINIYHQIFEGNTFLYLVAWYIIILKQVIEFHLFPSQLYYFLALIDTTAQYYLKYHHLIYVHFLTASPRQYWTHKNCSITLNWMLPKYICKLCLGNNWEYRIIDRSSQCPPAQSLSDI